MSEESEREVRLALNEMVSVYGAMYRTRNQPWDTPERLAATDWRDAWMVSVKRPVDDPYLWIRSACRDSKLNWVFEQLESYTRPVQQVR